MLNNLKIIKHRSIEGSKLLHKTTINKVSTRAVCASMCSKQKRKFVGNKASVKLSDIYLANHTTQAQLYFWLESGKIKHLESLVLCEKSDLIFEALKDFPNCVHLKTKEFLKIIPEYKVFLYN